MTDIPAPWLSIIDDIVGREGGYDSVTQIPGDKGGLTKAGVTIGAWEQYKRINALPVDTEIHHDLSIATKPDIQAFYWWYLSVPGITQLDPQWGTFIADCAVNDGPSKAILFAQQSHNAIFTSGLHVAEDGNLGQQTKFALDSMGLEVTVATFTKIYVKHWIDHYIDICVQNPTQLKFLQGWVNRAWSFL